MSGFFPTTCAMIKQNMELSRPVLVHCTEGKQQSCTVVAAFSIQSQGFIILEAKAKHPQALDCRSGIHFEQAIEHWERIVNRTAELGFNGTCAKSINAA